MRGLVDLPTGAWQPESFETAPRRANDRHGHGGFLGWVRFPSTRSRNFSYFRRRRVGVGRKSGRETEE
eukprot:scaffold22034_cov61-Phaeocystis_antarctica.AAC.2